MSALEQIPVDKGTGECLQDSQKAYLPHVLSTRKDLKKGSSEERSASKAGKNNFGNLVLSYTPLFDHSPSKQRCLSASQVQDAAGPSASTLPGTSNMHDYDKNEFNFHNLIHRLSPVIKSYCFSPASEFEERILDEVYSFDRGQKEVKFIQNLFKCLHSNIAREISESNSREEEKKRELRNMVKSEYFAHKEGKAQVFEGSDIYVLASVKALIDIRSSEDMTWTKMVSVVLTSIYRDQLKNLTAKGTRGTIGINTKLYDALFKEADKIFKASAANPNDEYGNKFNPIIFNHYVNKLTSNRKNKRKKRNINIPRSAVTSELKNKPTGKKKGPQDKEPDDVEDGNDDVILADKPDQEESENSDHVVMPGETQHARTPEPTSSQGAFSMINYPAEGFLEQSATTSKSNEGIFTAPNAITEAVKLSCTSESEFFSCQKENIAASTSSHQTMNEVSSPLCRSNHYDQIQPSPPVPRLDLNNPTHKALLEAMNLILQQQQQQSVY